MLWYFYKYGYSSAANGYLMSYDWYHIETKTNYNKGIFICYENYLTSGTKPTAGKYNDFYYELQGSPATTG